MPLVQKHDTLTDLIRKGAERKQLINSERQVQSEYYLGWRRDEDSTYGFGDPDSSGSSSGSGLRGRSGKGSGSSGSGSGRYDGPAPDLSKDRKLRISAWFLWIVDLPYIKLTRLFAIIIVFFTLTIGVSSHPEQIPHLLAAKAALEYIVNAYYILDGIAKMMSLHCYLVIARDLSQHVSAITTLRRSGFVDVAISLLCLVFEADGHSNGLKWLQLLRCMFLSLFFLEQMPQIDVLMVSSCAYFPPWHLIHLYLAEWNHRGPQVHPLHVGAHVSDVCCVLRARCRRISGKRPVPLRADRSRHVDVFRNGHARCELNCLCLYR